MFPLNVINKELPLEELRLIIAKFGHLIDDYKKYVLEISEDKNNGRIRYKYTL